MKAAKWRELSDDEMTQKVRDLSEEVFNHAARVLVGAADPALGDILDGSFAVEHGRRSPIDPDRASRFVWEEGDVEFLSREESEEILGRAQKQIIHENDGGDQTT